MSGNQSAMLDADGVPRSEPVASWVELADREAGIDPRSKVNWLMATLRFTRGDGSSVFGPGGRQPDRARALLASAERLGDASLVRVASGLAGSGRESAGGSNGALPTGSHSCPDRPLAVLRPDWSARGDLVAIDHRTLGPESLLEVASKGRVWLGPGWSSPLPAGRAGVAVPTSWTSGPYADCVEWSYQIGKTRTTRTAALLKGQGLALLAQQDEGPGPAIEARFSIPEGIEAIPDPELRSLTLSSGRGRPVARLIPLGLPCSPYRTGRGSLEVEEREVVVRQVVDGKRRWLAVLVSWEGGASSWRSLTVASRSEACPGDVAFAARVAWKRRGSGLVVYRSLAPADLRCFLGHQTRARFLVGSFDPLGDVRPILKVD